MHWMKHVREQQAKSMSCYVAASLETVLGTSIAEWPTAMH